MLTRISKDDYQKHKIECEEARGKSACCDTISVHLKTENNTKLHYQCIYMWTGWTHTKPMIVAAVRVKEEKSAWGHSLNIY